MNKGRPLSVCLASYDNRWFTRGRPRWVEAAWMLVQALFVSSWIPGARHRVMVLRLFGAQVGVSVDIKPGVRVKFPWRLQLGDHSWIGEDVWIDNLAPVTIGSNCCVSQGAYLCTGSHDWTRPAFDLTVKPIVIHDGAWIAARATLLPGVQIGEGAVVCACTTLSQNVEPWVVVSGSPARVVKRRTLHV